MSMDGWIDIHKSSYWISIVGGIYGGLRPITPDLYALQRYVEIVNKLQRSSL